MQGFITFRALLFEIKSPENLYHIETDRHRDRVSHRDFVKNTFFFLNLSLSFGIP